MRYGVEIEYWVATGNGAAARETDIRLCLLPNPPLAKIAKMAKMARRASPAARMRRPC